MRPYLVLYGNKLSARSRNRHHPRIDAHQVALERAIDGRDVEVRERRDRHSPATARDGDDLPKTLAERGIPYVLALRTGSVSLSAIGDGRSGGYLAMRHLLGQAIAEIGLPPDAYLKVESTFSTDAGTDAALTSMTLPDRPTAIFAVNDNTAVRPVQPRPPRTCGHFACRLY